MIDGVFWAVRSEAGTAIVQFLFAVFFSSRLGCLSYLSVHSDAGSADNVKEICDV